MGQEWVRRLSVPMVLGLGIAGSYLATDDAYRWFVLALLTTPVALGITTRRPVPLVMLWFGYVAALSTFVSLRQIADDQGVTVVYSFPIMVDRVLGFGQVPAIRLQGWLHAGDASSWLDRATVLGYGLHFVATWAVAVALVVRRHPVFAPFVLGMALMHLGAIPIHFLWPTAPPWMAGAEGYIEPVHRLLYAVAYDISPEMYTAGMRASGNDVAAMPSLHMGVAWVVCLASSQCGRLARAGGIGYALLTAWCTVYGGEHYVVDLIAGMLLAWAAWRVAGWLTCRLRLTGLFGACDQLEPS